MHGRTFACNLTIDSFSGPCRAIFTYVPVPPFTEFATDAREGVKLYKKKAWSCNFLSENTLQSVHTVEESMQVCEVSYQDFF